MCIEGHPWLYRLAPATWDFILKRRGNRRKTKNNQKLSGWCVSQIPVAETVIRGKWFERMEDTFWFTVSEVTALVGSVAFGPVIKLWQWEQLEEACSPQGG